MKFHYKILSWLLLSFLVCCELYAHEQKDSKKTHRKIVADKAESFTVRVLLDEHKNGNDAPWILKSSKGFILSDPDNPHKKMRFSTQRCAVEVKKDGVVYI